MLNLKEFHGRIIDLDTHIQPSPGNYELAGGEVIEEQQRFGALHDQIVDAHRDQVDSDRIVAVMVDRQLDLGPDPVVGRDQQRIGVARRGHRRDGGDELALAWLFRKCVSPLKVAR